jgi:hypothetical protein
MEWSLLKTTPIIDWQGDVAIIAAAVADDRTSFFCEHCREQHFHGQRNGYRMAHCTNADSRLRKSGYVLRDYVPEGPPRAA